MEVAKIYTILNLLHINAIIFSITTIYILKLGSVELEIL